MTRNPVFIALHDAMSTWLRQQRSVSLGMPKQEEIAYAAHRQIFKAIEKRDPNAAEAAMMDHIVQLSASYWSALEK
jgi:GntR family transcriptional repressor for pyruvate dehydrogenase complex